MTSIIITLRRFAPLGSLSAQRTVIVFIADSILQQNNNNRYELGGVAFCLSMLWAQIFPFVALHLFEGEEDVKRALTIYLGGSFGLWMLLNIAFFYTIDMSYFNTFIGTLTAPQYTVAFYNETDEDNLKFYAVFTNRMSYTLSIKDVVREWVAENIKQWEEERPEWFKIEKTGRR